MGGVWSEKAWAKRHMILCIDVHVPCSQSVYVAGLDPGEIDPFLERRANSVVKFATLINARGL